MIQPMMLILIYIMISLVCTTSATHSLVHRDVPEEDLCAPCELDFSDFSTKMRGTVCDMRLISAESFMNCRDICEELLGVENENSGKKKAEAIENCRCLCKEFKLKDKCSEDICDRPFKEIQCSNATTANSTPPLGVSRCFERSFEEAQAFNKCANNDLNDLPQSVLETAEGDLERGVEQCVCDCKYVEKQSPTEEPLNASGDPCSHNYDCTLSFRTRSKIRSNNDDNGNSFSDCQSMCILVFDDTPRSTKKKTRVTRDTEDCDCYCAMYHDPCPGGSPSEKLEGSGDHPCSHNYDCTLSFRTRSKIRSNIDDNGNSFSDCQSMCVSAFDDTPRSTKKKNRVNTEDCDCYCAMYHDPCPGGSPSDATMDCLQEALTNDFHSTGKPKSMFSPKTVEQLLQLDDISIDPENCQDQCVELLQSIKDKTRFKSKTIRRQQKQCRRFCSRYQDCLQQQTTGPQTPVMITESPETTACSD